MKIQAVQTIYVISLPFKSESKKGEILQKILNGKIIFSEIKKEDLSSIRIATTQADFLYAPKTIRLEVDSRHISKEKLEKILNKILDEIKVLFSPTNKIILNRLLD